MRAVAGGTTAKLPATIDTGIDMGNGSVTDKANDAVKTLVAATFGGEAHLEPLTVAVCCWAGDKTAESESAVREVATPPATGEILILLATTGG